MRFANPAHSVIALWCHPRSMSTATERIMRERGDLICFHEPFMYYYYVHRNIRDMPEFDIDPDQPTSFDAIIEHLFDAAATGPVFFKDMAYYIDTDLPQHAELAAAMTHLFLIRDPRRTILSYHQLDPALTCEEVGIEAQWSLANWLHETTGERPVIIAAEAVQADAPGIIGAVWDRIGLDPKPQAFDWDGSPPPEDWKRVAGWHKDVVSSTGIRGTDLKDDAGLDQKFAAAADKAPKLAAFLAHHQPFYERLKAWDYDPEKAHG